MTSHRSTRPAPRHPATSRTRLAIALVALGASACAHAGASDAPEADSTAVAVIAHPVALSTHPWSTTASGIVHANTTVDIAFQVPGKVVHARPDEGEPVTAGQTVAWIDPTEYAFAVEQATARSERAARDLGRHRPLHSSGSISAADMEHLESDARQSAAAAGIATKRLADTRLTAPISGIVARRAIEVGMTVAPGQPVYTIVALDPVRVRVGIPQGDIGRVSEGAAATVRIPALDTTFTGRVSLVGVAADPVTRSYSVEISVANPARRLRAGMVATATITADDVKTSAIMVPASAVLRDATSGAPTVYVLDSGSDRAHARRVTTGAVRGDSLEITSGLALSDRVVVAGHQRLRTGARVTPLRDSARATALLGSDRP